MSTSEKQKETPQFIYCAGVGAFRCSHHVSRRGDRCQGCQKIYDEEEARRQKKS